MSCPSTSVAELFRCGLNLSVCFCLRRVGGSVPYPSWCLPGICFPCVGNAVGPTFASCVRFDYSKSGGDDYDPFGEVSDRGDRARCRDV